MQLMNNQQLKIDPGIIKSSSNHRSSKDAGQGRNCTHFRSKRDNANAELRRRSQRRSLRVETVESSALAV